MKIKKAQDHVIALDPVDEDNVLSLITLVREGVRYAFFEKVASNAIFNIAEWSAMLHLSARTMQRYKREKRKFDPVQSEKILQIALLYRKGEEVFGSKEGFNTWLNSENVALGSVKPRELMDNSFSLTLLKEELGRIENGIFA